MTLWHEFAAAEKTIVEQEATKPRRQRGIRHVPHWLAWPLMFLGIWYLPLPLGGYYWSAYVLGLLVAVAYGAWARRAFRVDVVERSETSTVLRIERIVRPRAARRHRLLRIAVIAIVGLFTVTALVNQLLVKPKPSAIHQTGIPPNLQDSGPLPTVQGPSGESRIEPTYSRVAEDISGFGAEVRCWSVADWRTRTDQWGEWNGRRLGPWGGYTSGYRIHLSPSICASLDMLAYGRVPVEQSPWPEALAWSVSALAHESQHVRGFYDEAVAECYAVQTIERTAVALGRTKGEGRLLAELYWNKSYLKQRDPDYVSKECRDDGRLDIRPQSHVWP